MPYYRSATGKNVIVKLGKNKKEIKITPKPELFPYDGLHLLFPKHIIRIGKLETIAEPEPITKKNINERIKKEIIRQNPQTFQEQFLKDSLPTGSWKGQRCFIIGGGPSLKGFDFKQLKGEKIIAINKAFVDAPFPG